MLEKIKNILSSHFDSDHENASSLFSFHEKAIAGLLMEVANADHQISDEEVQTKNKWLNKILNLDEKSIALLVNEAREESKNATSLYQYTDKLRELSEKGRFDLIKAMWEIAYADGHLDPFEELVIRKTAELLYLDHSLFIKAKIDTKSALDGAGE